MARLAIAGLLGLAVFLTYSLPEVEHAQSAPPSLVSATSQPATPNLTLANTQPLSTTYEHEAELVLDTKINANERRTRLHKLIEAGEPAATALATIAIAPLQLPPGEVRPHSLQEMNGKTERSLRVTALEALDRLGTTHPEIAAQMLTVADEQADPLLKFLAQVSATGIQQGRPGKLGRMIDKMVQ